MSFRDVTIETPDRKRGLGVGMTLRTGSVRGLLLGFEKSQSQVLASEEEG